jgi:hypothetical protein
MDWENPEWRNKFWALMAATVFPLLQHLDEAGRMSEATPKKKVKVGQAIKKVLELVERDFGRLSMTHVVGCVSKLMDHVLGPLDAETVEKLEAEGAQLRGITSIIFVR